MLSIAETAQDGTALLYLVAHDQSWSSNLVVISQPDEEIAAGAQDMLDDSRWEKAPQPRWCTASDAMAMGDSWRASLHCEGSHSSQTQDSSDPIVLGAHIITRIHDIVSCEIYPRTAAVVTVGTLHAGLKENLIRASAEFTLNVRNLRPDTRENVLAALRRIIKGEAETSGAPEPTIEEICTFPRNYNDPEETAAAVAARLQELGDDAVREMSPAMGSEDFRILTTGLRAALTVLLSKLGS